MRDGRSPEVSHKDDVLKWVCTGLTTDELQQRLLALTDAECAVVTKCVVAFLFLAGAADWWCRAGCIVTATS